MRLEGLQGCAGGGWGQREEEEEEEDLGGPGRKKKIWPVIRSQSFTGKLIRHLKEHLRLENTLWCSQQSEEPLWGCSFFFCVSADELCTLDYFTRPCGLRAPWKYLKTDRKDWTKHKWSQPTAAGFLLVGGEMISKHLIWTWCRSHLSCLF